MATKKVTTTVNGVPHTTTVKAGTASGGSPSGVPAAVPGVSGAGSFPASQGLAKASGGVKDAIRAPGDTRYTDQFGEDAAAQAAQTAATGIQTPTPAGVQPPAQTGVPSLTNVPGADPGSTTAPGAPVSTPAAAATPTQNKYQQGLAAAQASGAPAPADAGQARMQASAYTPADAPDTSGIDQFLSADPQVNNLMKGITDLLNPQQQTSTLMDDYQKMYKQSGLGDINKEIIDAETVINGTEDDIRNEIQTAGGFGTESQVQAMSLSRNKSLLTRYNQLVQMKTDATNQLNTLSQLNQQDKSMAQEKLNSQISNMFNLANFRQQATKNVQEAFNNMVAKVGYAGAYQAYASDPRQLGFIEQTMGLQSGGLKTLAAQPDLDMQLKQANLANIYSEIDARNQASAGNNTLNGKPQTTVQAQIQGYADRTNASDNIISKVGGDFTKLGSLVGMAMPNFLKTSDRQQYEQAQRDFVNSVLRRESGAAISSSEFENAKQQYFPQPGDSKAVVEQKTANRQLVVNNLYQQSNTGRTTLPGQVIQYQGKEYQVDDNGEMQPL